MVRAILEGRKTQTRRVIKPQPICVEECRAITGSGYDLFTDPHHPGEWRIAGPVGVVCERSGLPNGYQWKCKYTAGMRLWVRETYLTGNSVHSVTYKADLDSAEAAGFGAKYGGWKPSIFMPRWASRITLEVTAVRPERVQSITDSDSVAEGVGSSIDRISTNFPGKWVNMYRELWDPINAKRGFPWASNPWVWVVEFKRV